MELEKEFDGVNSDGDNENKDMDAKEGTGTPGPSKRIEVDGELWFTFNQLKRILRVSHTTLYTYIKNGKVIKEDFDGVDLYRLNGYW